MAVSNRKQIQYLTRLQLCNLYGINVFRHSKDKKVKRRMLGLMAAYVLVALVLVFYMGGMAYGLIWLGMGELTMTYLILVASLLSLIFSIFKAGSVLFEKGSYDTLCALPVTKSAIVISRLIRM